MSTKFKIGDIVERIHCGNGGRGARLGQVATVVGYHDGLVAVDYPSPSACGYGPFPDAELWNTYNAKLLAPALPPAPSITWTTISGETSRTYHFADGSTFKVVGVKRLCVRPTSHRLETEAGGKVIIPGKFTAITIDAPEWSA